MQSITTCFSIPPGSPSPTAITSDTENPKQPCIVVTHPRGADLHKSAVSDELVVHGCCYWVDDCACIVTEAVSAVKLVLKAPPWACHWLSLLISPLAIP